MTNTDLTLIAALLDRSGSMQDCKRATETGFDELINKQRVEPGTAIVTLSMFDDVYENVYANIPIGEVGKLELEPRNMTAMLDATGRFITEIGEQLAALPEGERPGTVICLIMTDGYENASKQWTWAAVEELITHQREKYNWQFIFLGANIDAEVVGARMGVPRASSMTYDVQLTGVALESTARAMSGIRAGVPMGFTPEERKRSRRRK